MATPHQVLVPTLTSSSPPTCPYPKFAPADDPSRRPHPAWEWRERFPELSRLLGSSFHQDFSVEHRSHAEVVDDYLTPESPETAGPPPRTSASSSRSARRTTHCSRPSAALEEGPGVDGPAVVSAWRLLKQEARARRSPGSHGRTRGPRMLPDRFPGQ
ncbi:contact-dependent growth inhibition system immunity protein [Streptomyces sp. NPDC058385]|uniref:contact-dependent growth inhibition system immunity protein n=1 Tax=Streptomyces sp. NPDC058385 TaxID=3346473 RepID=UPI003646CB21